MRLLLVEDNTALAEAICLGMTSFGHTIDSVDSAEHGWLSIQNQIFDAVLLDINLPGMSGLTLLKKIRTATHSTRGHTPVILLTARDTAQDKIVGLGLGADDYVVKPFDLGELDARLRAVVRRVGGHSANILKRGNLCMDTQGFVVSVDDEPVGLSRKEFAILKILLEANGRVVASHTIESKLYAWDSEVVSNSIQVHVSNLRKKLGKSRIKTIVGVGYAME